MSSLPPPLPYSFAAEAAAEARAISRRYWAKGGEADRRFPPRPTPGWYVKAAQAESEAAT